MSSTSKTKADPINDLIKKRKGMIGRINKLKKLVNTFVAPYDESKVDTGFEDLKYLKNYNSDVFDEILPLCADDVEIAVHQQVFDDEDDRLNELEWTLVKMKKTLVATTAATKPVDVKLPQLELPSFSGDIKEWISFQDAFVASIHSVNMADVQKLQYLKRSLKGEAEALLQNFAATDTNYPIAWDLLKSTYDNKREILRAHLDKLFAFPYINQINPEALKKLGNTINQCIQTLDVMKLTPEEKVNLILIHMLCKKLDADSKREWERTLKPDSIPTIKEFIEFIATQARITAAAGVKNRITNQSNQGSPIEKKFKATAHLGTNRPEDCLLCQKGKHYLSKCREYKKMTPGEKKGYVHKTNRCLKCLSQQHKVADCTFHFNCHHCSEPHHTSLHPKNNNHSSSSKKPTSESEQSKSEATPEEKETTTTLLSCSMGINNNMQTLLSTALILVKNSKNEFITCRALLDNGSQCSFITKKCATKLGLKTHKVKIPISGLGDTDVGTSQMGVELEFGSKYDSKKTFLIEAHVMTSITGSLPSAKINTERWNHIKTLQLADPFFYEPGNIDVLLGGDIYVDLMKSKIKPGDLGTATAMHTVLGWVLLGKYANPVQTGIKVHHAICNTPLISDIHQFWELEEVPTKRILTVEEKTCEEQFNKTHLRDEDGRYIVRLPFKNNRNPIGESRSNAMVRLHQMEKRFLRNPELGKQYNEVLQEYEDLGHMEKIPESELSPDKEIYYMPHHCVLKESTTTSLRVVFDASAKSKSGVSLNETLMVGPKLQDDLIAILMRFRLHEIVMTADIAKMYRQVKIMPEDTDYQRIVWRKPEEKQESDYRLLTATFGTSSAPYQAVKCVQNLAQVEAENYSEASKVVLSDFYVDDLMTGSSNKEEAMKLQRDLIDLLAKGKFQLRKWSSNSIELLNAVPPDMRETKAALEINLDSSLKTLGLLWHPAQDYFSFTVNVTPEVTLTKRKVLSEMAKIFDPLGWLSPVTMKAKIFFQELWKEKLNWDDPLNEEQKSLWKKYTEELKDIEGIKIPRLCATTSTSTKYYLDGFCDASEQAYAAVVYLRSKEATGPEIRRLVALKTKVAPVKKQITIPRLELCGALLLKRLMECVKDALKLEIVEMNAWTDSTIVLGWLTKHPSTLKIFVGNRVAEIQEFLPPDLWSHIKGTDNPADCASRGVFLSELNTHPLWWTGPSLESLFDAANSVSLDDEEEMKKEYKPCKSTTVTTIAKEVKDDLLYVDFNKYNNWEKLVDDVAHLFKDKNNDTNPLSVQERNSAKKFIIKKMQSDPETGFAKDINKLNQRTTISKHLRPLTPFMDPDGILRVGGRNEYANMDYDKKHQMLLSRKHRVTKLIVEHCHLENGHAGSQLLLARLQEKYWIIGGRDFVREIIKECRTCVKLRAKTSQQLMGNLPESRVNSARAFVHCGVDYAGPFTLKNPKGRSPTPYKGYVVVFVCFTTKAVNLDLASDLTAQSFLNTFKRFVSARGKPAHLYSDCGTNFVGANRELKDYLAVLREESSQVEIKEYLAKQEIEWHYNVPSAPHHGGLWEAAVKSMKFHLKRIIGLQVLDFEEMLTILKQIEACMNSRPLFALSTDPNDLAPLTPGHFLIGDAMTAAPEPSLLEIKVNRLSRWQQIQQMFQHFWKRWSDEYLVSLQGKPKWWTERENLKIGQMVSIKDDDTPPLMWKTGRIVETFPGKDGKVRAVRVKTDNGELNRPIVKLCPLPKD